MERRATSVDAFSAAVVARMPKAPEASGLEHLPVSPRFVLAANHYQRRGLWILHSASVLTQAVRQHYGPSLDPPVRWIVTANWPPIRLGPLTLRSPGDILLPRVADALACYPVSFARTSPGFTARSLRRILREAPVLTCPVGIFPEGVADSAGVLIDPLPGVERLLAHLAKHGLPVQPAAISEGQGRLMVKFGPTIACNALLSAPDEAARLTMRKIGELLEQE
jgi:1-acyl-sn-glycerol-3-phosphate acyltransferase